MSDGLDEAYLRFAHFLQRAGFDPQQWSLAIDSGGEERGVHATRDITVAKPAATTSPPSHAPVISIPASLLITPERVRSSSFARLLLPASGLASLSAEQLLILWLVYQRRQGQQSSASPYLALLPSYYSTLEWWTEAEVQLLPHALGTAAAVGRADSDGDSCSEVAGQDEPSQYHRSLCTRLRAQWELLNALLSAQHTALQPCHSDPPSNGHALPLTVRRHQLPPASHPLCTPTPSHPLSCLVSLAEYQWAHGTVATRSCYWPEGRSCCLVPFLDMLNHSADIECTCGYDGATRLYSLYTQHRPSAGQSTVAPLLHVPAGGEVHISYGALSNWQLLVRYGFVLQDNVHEKEDVGVKWLESFIQQRCSAKERRPIAQPPSTPASKAAAPELSDVRCCCGRKQLRQSLVHLRPSVATAAQPPHVPVLSSKHAKLLSLCGLYSPSAFSLTCCAAPWDLTAYIKCRTVPLPPPGAPQPTSDTLQRWADAILNDEWVDEAHERRGRELLAAVLVGRMDRSEQGEGDSSLLQQMDELAAWRSSSEKTAESGGDVQGTEENGGGVGSVSVLCRVLSGQFRTARRRMLLGALQHQLHATRLFT